MSDDSFAREVDEELRRERLTAFWKRYGGFIMTAAVLVVAFVAGFKGWEAWQAHQAGKGGEDFLKAVQLIQDGKTEDARRELERIAREGSGGYRDLATLRLAGLMAKAGDTAGALKQYELAAKSSDDMTADFARLEAAMLRLEEADVSEIQSRVEAVNTPNHPLRNQAREIVGLAQFKAGDRKAAEASFNAIVADQAAPNRLRERARVMLILLAEPSSATGADVSAAGEGAAAAKSKE